MKLQYQLGNGNWTDCGERTSVRREIMTIAEKIVQEFFGDSPDGQEWPEGFAGVLEDRSTCQPYRPVRDGDVSNSLIYEMGDGSCIVESGGAWDYGYTGTSCGCWASQPHHCGEKS